MFELIGRYEDRDYCYCEGDCHINHVRVTEDILATFDHEADAMAFVKECEIEKGKDKYSYYRNRFDYFKKGSILYGYEEAIIRPNVMHGVPHNPGIGEISKYELVGISDTYDKIKQTIVATFDTKEKAEEYFEWSKLYNYTSWGQNPNFRKQSLLRPYRNAQIRPQYIETPVLPPHNPSIEYVASSSKAHTKKTAKKKESLSNKRKVTTKKKNRLR